MAKDELNREWKKFRDALIRQAERHFEAGYKDFVDDIRKRNIKSNLRLFRRLWDIKGRGFVADLKAFMAASKDQFAVIRVAKTPKGVYLPDNRFTNIRGCWIEKHPSGFLKDCTVYIQVKDNRWIYYEHSQTATGKKNVFP